MDPEEKIANQEAFINDKVKINVATSAFVDVPRGCCVALSVRNVSAQAIDVSNANLMIERVA